MDTRQHVFLPAYKEDDGDDPRVGFKRVHVNDLTQKEQLYLEEINELRESGLTGADLRIGAKKAVDKYLS